MDYASSYAMGASPLGDRGNAQAAHASVQVLPPPKPERMHWSTILFGAGTVICAIAVLATIAGVPASMGYDVDSPGKRVKPTSNDPLKISQAIDSNIKWLVEHSDDKPGNYVGLIESINRNEIAIGGMVQALMTMNASVTAIDQGLGELGGNTAAMGADVDAMAATSQASGDTMQALAGDIGFLSRSMVELANATEDLTTRMGSIEAKAGAIASGGTSAALENTKELNASLPEGVPVPLTDKGEPYDVALQRLQGAQGGGGAGAAATTSSGGASFQ